MAFKEFMVKKQKTGKDVLLGVLCYILATVVSLALFVILAKTPFGGISLLLIVGAFYAAHMYASRLNKEFEYICTDDTVDIDMIFNKSRRKRLISFTLGQTEVIASVKDERYNSQSKGSFDKVIDATSGANENVYFAIVEKNGRNLVKFEPSASVLEHLSQYARSKVHIYN